VVDLEQRLRSAAGRLPGDYRSDAEINGASEAQELIRSDPALDAPARQILARFLAGGSVDEARLAAYLLESFALPSDSLMAGYRRGDLPAFERSKIGWALGKALLDAPAPPPELARWAQDTRDGAAFWGAYFVRQRAAFDRDAAQQLARDPMAAANQLWFAATLLRDAEYDALVAALKALEPTFGAAWVGHLESTLAAVRQSSAPADRAAPARA
jgi:hypothetical protein